MIKWDWLNSNPFIMSFFISICRSKSEAVREYLKIPSIENDISVATERTSTASWFVIHSCDTNQVKNIAESGILQRLRYFKIQWLIWLHYRRRRHMMFFAETVVIWPYLKWCQRRDSIENNCQINCIYCFHRDYTK